MSGPMVVPVKFHFDMIQPSMDLTIFTTFFLCFVLTMSIGMPSVGAIGPLFLVLAIPVGML